MFKYFQYTGTTGSPVLDYPAVGSLPAIQVPLVMTDYKIQNRNPKVSVRTGIPLFHSQSNNAVGGFLIGMGVSEMPKFSIAGFMDTPGQQQGTFLVSALEWSGGQFLTYGDYIAMMMEGRGRLNNEYDFAMIDPNWFRDPFGRQFNVRILEFSATFQEGRPLRQNFNMTLVVTKGYDG